MHNVLTKLRTHALGSVHAITRSWGQRQSLFSSTQTYHKASPPLALCDETIYALSTAPGRAALATVRASGPHCLQIYHRLCPYKPLLEPRRATIRKLRDPVDRRNIVDTAALVLYFPAPKTVTGEDVLELQIHGGPATQKAVLRAIANVAAVTRLPIRYAEPGEFTRRAFQNEKLDLIQIEALSDTLAAETEQQRRAAVRGDSGRLGIIYDQWRDMLLLARGELEALIDFSEDQHFEETPQELLTNVTKLIDDILLQISQHSAASHCGELLKRGIRVSLLGPPNVGKSSLLNKLVGREASIVSQEAGTTRDVVEVSLDMKGYLCTFADTAGLRNGSQSLFALTSSIGAVEQEGIRRAKEKAINSDIIIVMASLEWIEQSKQWKISYDDESFAIAAKASHVLVVVNKCDQAISLELLSELIKNFKSKVDIEFLPHSLPAIFKISCLDEIDHITRNSRGKIPDIISHLISIFEKMTEVPVDMEDLIGVTERQRILLTSCCVHLQDFKDASDDIVLAAEHLRLAASCLARITGRGETTDVEELLGVVFEKFCVGK